MTAMTLRARNEARAMRARYEAPYKRDLKPIYRKVGDLMPSHFDAVQDVAAVGINVFDRYVSINSNRPEIVDYFSSLFREAPLPAEFEAQHRCRLVTGGIPFGKVAALFGDELAVLFRVNARNRYTDEEQVGCLVFTKSLATGIVSSSLYGEIALDSVFPEWEAILSQPGPIDTLTYNILELKILEHVSRRIPGGYAVHACSAETSAGAILFPGYSCSGKSTLAMALLASGLSAVYDEAACLFPEDLTMRPLVRNMIVRSGTCDLIPSLPIRQTCQEIRHGRDAAYRVETKAMFGPRSQARGPSRLKNVVFLSGFGPESILTPMKTSESILQLTTHNLIPVQNGWNTFTTLCHSFESVRCYSFMVGPPLEAARVLGEFFGVDQR